MATDLHSEIQQFLAETGMSPSYFGKVAANNSMLVPRLERGRTVTLVTAEKIQRFMRENRDWRKARRSAA